MRAREALLITLSSTLLAATGCSKTTKDRLQGRWLGESVENVPTAQVSQVTGWAKGTAVEFSGSKVTVTIPAETPRTGSYQIAKDDGKELTIAFSRAEGGHDEARFRFVGEDTLRWALPDGPEIVLVRSKN